MTPDLFDHAEAQARKEHGKSVAATNRAGALESARGCAWNAAFNPNYCEGEIGQVTADGVARYYEALGHDWAELGNAAGSIFKGKEWEWTGRFVASTRPSSHGRMIRVWRYCPNGEGVMKKR